MKKIKKVSLAFMVLILCIVGIPSALAWIPGGGGDYLPPTSYHMHDWAEKGCYFGQSDEGNLFHLPSFRNEYMGNLNTGTRDLYTIEESYRESNGNYRMFIQWGGLEVKKADSFLYTFNGDINYKYGEIIDPTDPLDPNYNDVHWHEIRQDDVNFDLYY